MTVRIILLSGAVSSGKSTLSRSLMESEGALVFRTREVLQRRVPPELAGDRKELQSTGDQFDRDSNHLWVLAEFKNWRETVDGSKPAVVDSVRTLDQVNSFRAEFGPSVVHVHLTAPVGQLEERFNKRQQGQSKIYPFAEVRSNPTEQNIEALAKVADLVVNTFRCTEADVLTRTNSHLGVRHTTGRGYVDVVVGGQVRERGEGADRRPPLR